MSIKNKTGPNIDPWGTHLVKLAFWNNFLNVLDESNLAIFLLEHESTADFNLVPNRRWNKTSG